MGVRVFVTAQASGGKVKNENPRAQFDQLKDNSEYGDLLVRAQAAHQNGLESFPVFAAGLLAAMVAGVDKKTVGKLAAFHLFMRGIFNTAYIGFCTPAAGLVRSSAWIGSLLSSCQL